MIALAACLLATSLPAAGQQPEKPSQPYAAINREAIDYRGPGRETVHDLAGPEIRIGLLVPLRGPRKAEGEALLTAAQIAMEEESARPLPDGRRLTLVWRDESGLWGRAASEIVNLVFEDQAVALVTSADGAAAHLAEQVGNRIGVPVLTLASDSTTTQINIPWLFRVVPDDAAQARAFAEDIYRQRDLHKVLLITEDDHDGRVGREEFEKAARRLNAPAPTHAQIALPLADDRAWVAKIKSQAPEAIVLWASAEVAARVLATIKQTEEPVEVYVCHKALQEPFMIAARDAGTAKIWIAAADLSASETARRNFDARFQRRTGALPSPASREMYDAVRLITAGLRQAGPNRARLRDQLAQAQDFAGVSGWISFDGAGNNHAAVILMPLQ